MRKFIGLFALLIACHAFAANNNPAKEDTTPPAAEGILPADKIPPLLSLDKPASTPTPAPPVENE